MQVSLVKAFVLSIIFCLIPNSPVSQSELKPAAFLSSDLVAHRHVPVSLQDVTDRSTNTALAPGSMAYCLLQILLSVHGTSIFQLPRTVVGEGVSTQGTTL